MKKIFLPAMIVVLAFTTIAGDWKTVTLMDKVTVSLPAAAAEENSKEYPCKRLYYQTALK